MPAKTERIIEILPLLLIIVFIAALGMFYQWGASDVNAQSGISKVVPLETHPNEMERRLQAIEIAVKALKPAGVLYLYGDERGFRCEWSDTNGKYHSIRVDVVTTPTRQLLQVPVLCVEADAREN